MLNFRNFLNLCYWEILQVTFPYLYVIHFNLNSQNIFHTWLYFLLQKFINESNK